MFDSKPFQRKGEINQHFEIEPLLYVFTFMFSECNHDISTCIQLLPFFFNA